MRPGNSICENQSKADSSHDTVKTCFHLTLCMLGNFACFFVICGFCCFFLKLTDSKKSFRKTINVKQFWSRAGPTFCWAWPGSKLFAKVISRLQKSPLVGKELIWNRGMWENTEQYYNKSMILATPSENVPQDMRRQCRPISTSHWQSLIRTFTVH